MLENIEKYLKFFITLGVFFSSCKSGVNNKTSNSTTAIQVLKDNHFQFVLKLVPGIRYNYMTTTETAINLEVDNKEIKTANNATIALLYEVLHSSYDSMVIKLSYDKIHLELTDDEEKKIMDASNTVEEQTPMDKLLESIKGESLIVTLNKKGKVLKVTGSKEIMDKVIAGLNIYDDENTKQTIKAQIGKLVGDDFIKSNIAETFNFYPDTTVATGSIWQRKNVQSGEMNYVANTTYTLSSLNDGVASIETNSQVNTGNTTSNIMGQQVNVDLKGGTNGSFEADISTGMIINGKSKTELEGTVQIMNKVVPIVIIIKRKLTVKKL